MVKKYLKELKQNQIITILHHPKYKFKRRVYINFNGLMNRYPKLPIEIPAKCKMTDKAAQILRKSGGKVLQSNILRQK